MLSFGNPAGFWALLALPAILAIHFLQRESRRVVTSTLFLLEQLVPASAQGRRFERLRHSVPLWLQLLAALLLTWLLVQPRWLRRDSTQRVVIVLDSSVSMLAFRDALDRELDAHTAALASAAVKTEWHVIESDMSRPTIYSGADRAALLEAVKHWSPHLGAHDFTAALQLAQTLLHGRGTLIFVSDRACALPAGVKLLAIGRPLENCGFAGANVNGRQWQALVKNYGAAVQRRTWWIEASGQKSPAQELTLEPGQSSALRGEIPPGASGCEIVLSGDSFALDDRLPIVQPQPKPLQIVAEPGSPFADFFAQFAGSVESVGSGKPDVRLTSYNSLAPALPNETAIVFVVDPGTATAFLPGNVVAENHPLTADLNWSGLLCRDTQRVAAKPGDQTLVWQGDRPLVFLRESGAAHLLVVNFDLRASNATRLPAFVLLLHRFIEQVSAAKVAAESRNLDTNQPINVAADPALPAPAIDGERGPLRAPATPGFFDVKQGTQILLHGAAQFADAREADFRDASFIDQLREPAAQLMAQNSAADLFAPIWTLALGVAMIGSWAWRQS